MQVGPADFAQHGGSSTISSSKSYVQALIQPCSPPAVDPRAQGPRHRRTRLSRPLVASSGVALATPGILCSLGHHSMHVTWPSCASMLSISSPALRASRHHCGPWHATEELHQGGAPATSLLALWAPQLKDGPITPSPLVRCYGRGEKCCKGG